MQKPFVTVAILAGSLFAVSAGAQTPAPVPVETPSSPAPVVSAPAAAPNQIIYSPRLPSAAELSSAAAAQGVAVERIEQTAAQITVTYKYANGQSNTVAYQLLPTSGTAAPAPATVVQTAPSPTVVYAPAPPPRVIYYEEPVYYPRYYYPYYPPVSFGFGFGYRHFGGGYHHRH